MELVKSEDWEMIIGQNYDKIPVHELEIIHASL